MSKHRRNARHAFFSATHFSKSDNAIIVCHNCAYLKTNYTNRLFPSFDCLYMKHCGSLTHKRVFGNLTTGICPYTIERNKINTYKCDKFCEQTHEPPIASYVKTHRDEYVHANVNSI